MGEPEKISIIGNMTRFMKLICFTVLLCGLSRSSSLSNDFDTAVKKGDVEMVRLLLAETESKKLMEYFMEGNKGGHTCLMLATLSKNVEIFKLILDKIYEDDQENLIKFIMKEDN